MPWQDIILKFEGAYRASRKAKRVEVVNEVFQAVSNDCRSKKIKVGLNPEGFARVRGLHSTTVSY